MSPFPYREVSAEIVAHYVLLQNVLVCTCTSLDFQLTKNSKHPTFFVSYECKLKPWFSNVHCFRKFPSHAHVQRTDDMLVFDVLIHSSYIKRSATRWYLVGNIEFAAIYRCRPVLRQLVRDNAAHAPNTCTNSCNESNGTSIGIAATYYFNLWICGYVGRYCSQLLF
jgi:hypothetical protein